ncbi:MAG: hypothetical protein LKM32_11525 [Chiayiivirga sp.]|jgi:hypothetical protein|uniref:hypothetical protein n=1 Tax=Chiayiivirga sp. TaxID=2041042 RepID=UPI0025BE07F8|nr:hypothetical protein [Chiayiivirga sp.]MCI1729979.1 hypothetical protein [Chiayiivirga sp.]
MNRTSAFLLGSLLLAATAVHADTLLIERVESEPELPVRGLSMGDIEARYGAPEERLDPRGGQKSQWPVINRWVYPSFVVYFEDSRVIDVVARKAAPLETGPKPVQ